MEHEMLPMQESKKSGYWSDPATWGGAIPSGHVIVNHVVTLDTIAEVCSIEINNTLSFDRKKVAILQSAGNIEVNGRLISRSYGSDHIIRFKDIDQSSFVGGGMDVMASDPGLWVRGSGILDIEGVNKTPWTNLAGGAKKGEITISLKAAPKGWRVGDQISITPTGSDHTSFDLRVIKNIVRGLVTLDRPLSFDHPVVGDYTAEVLNLTRSMKVQGKGHINIMSSRPSFISFVEIDSLGPQQKVNGFYQPVLGRYPLHFHHCMDGSNGSAVMGVVVKNSGGHAFVPHASHGITFSNCIAYNVFEDAFWWDVPPDKGKDTFNFSNNITFDRCVSAIVKSDPPFRGYRLSNFLLGSGVGNVITNCIATGNQGNGNAAGYHWPESSNYDPNVWTFSGNVAHNNKVNGIFVWQNDKNNHIIDSFAAYNNSVGIEHGAYSNGYKYRNITLLNNRYSILLHANTVTKDGTPDEDGYVLSFRNINASDPAVLTRRITDSPYPVLFKDCLFPHVIIDELPNGTGIKPGLVDFVNCGVEFKKVSMMPGSKIRVQEKNRAIQITTKGMESIPIFYQTKGE